MSTILILIFFIILIFLMLICNRTKRTSPSLVLGGRPEPIGIEPEDFSNELQVQLNIPPSLQYKDPDSFTDTFYNQQITSFYNLQTYPWLQAFFSSFEGELLNLNNQVPLVDLRANNNYDDTTYIDIYESIATGDNIIDKRIVRTFESTYPHFLKNTILPIGDDVYVDAMKYYYKDIQILLRQPGFAAPFVGDAPSFRYPFEVIMLIVAENEYPTDKFYVWGEWGKILILFLSTFVIKYEVEKCERTLESIKRLRDSFIGLYSYLDIEDKIDSEQLFRTYKSRLNIINRNEQENIFHKKVIKEGLITLQKEGRQLEKILEQERNTENLDQLKCIQNRIKNRIRSL